MLCDVGSMTQRTMRPVFVTTGPRKYYPPVNKIRIRTISEVNADRCYSEIGNQDEKDIQGTLNIRVERTVAHNLVGKEVREMLEREHGFTFHVVSGVLRVVALTGSSETVSDPDASPSPPSEEIIDFTGGRAIFREFQPGEDALRLMQDFPAQRKIELTLTSKKGHKFRFPLIMLDSQ
jgi:hypothetical protein